MRVKARTVISNHTPLMQETTLPSWLAGAARPERPVTPRATATPPASIFLPKEHGSWSLALEPLALGLWVAPSLAGGALLAAALAGFFARRPAKAAFAATHSPRRREAREALCMLTALVVAGGFEAFVLGGPIALWPLALAAPFGGLFAYFDAQGEGRAAAAEVAGSAAFAVLPAVFATLAGRPAGIALALALLALARSVPAVLTIRTFLRRRKGEAASPAPALAAAGVGLAAAAGLVWFRLLPFAAAGAVLVLSLRTAWFMSPWRPAWSARRAGMFEAVLGLAYVLFLAMGLGENPGP